MFEASSKKEPISEFTSFYGINLVTSSDPAYAFLLEIPCGQCLGIAGVHRVSSWRQFLYFLYLKCRAPHRLKACISYFSEELQMALSKVVKCELANSNPSSFRPLSLLAFSLYLEREDFPSFRRLLRKVGKSVPKCILIELFAMAFSKRHDDWPLETYRIFCDCETPVASMIQRSGPFGYHWRLLKALIQNAKTKSNFNDQYGEVLVAVVQPNEHEFMSLRMEDLSDLLLAVPLPLAAKLIDALMIYNRPDVGNRLLQQPDDASWNIVKLIVLAGCPYGESSPPVPARYYWDYYYASVYPDNFGEHKELHFESSLQFSARKVILTCLPLGLVNRQSAIAALCLPKMLENYLNLSDHFELDWDAIIPKES